MKVEGMDPRLRRRRVEVRRDEGRHRLHVLMGITGVVVAGCAGWGATRSPLLDLDNVRVVGAAHISADEVRSVSGIRLGGALTDIDVAAVARAVEAIPWVQQATVTRRWPSTLSIRLTERSPVAAMTADAVMTPDAGTTAAGTANAGAFALVDRSGRVVDRVAVVPAGMVTLAGLALAGNPGTQLSPEGVATLSVAIALPPSLMARTVGVSPATGGRGEVELRLSPDATVKLGTPDDLPRKFDAVATVLARVDMRNLAVVDVRRPESPVLTRRESSTKVSTPRTG